MIPHWQCECFLFQCPRIAIYFGKADDKTLSWKKKTPSEKRIKSLHKSCISRSTFPKGRRNTANNLQVEKISKTSMGWKRFTDNVKLRKNTKYKPKYSKTAKSFRCKSHSHLWKSSHWMLFPQDCCHFKLRIQYSYVIIYESPFRIHLIPGFEEQRIFRMNPPLFKLVLSEETEKIEPNKCKFKCEPMHSTKRKSEKGTTWDLSNYKSYLTISLNLVIPFYLSHILISRLVFLISVPCC